MSAKSPKPTTTKTAIGSPKSAKAAAAVSPSKRPASEMTTDVKPKKALSAYFIWLNECGRKEIIAKQFNGSGKDVAKIAKAAGEVWKSMSDADKKKWNEKAVKDKERHAKEMESYVPSETSEPKKKKGKKGKKEKDPNKPKRNLSAYFFFLAEARPEIVRVDLKGDKSKVAEVTKIGGQKWKALDAKAKEKYDQLAAKDKERYAKEMEEYKKSGGGAADDDEDDDEDEE
jgi:hypothetical protein